MQLPETWPAILALVVIACAIAGGALTAFLRCADKNLSFDPGLMHGRAGVAGILLLILAWFSGGETAAFIKPALGLFILAASGGVVLYFLIRRKGVLSKPLIAAHGLLALAGLYALLFGLPL